jgi:hypothetical protein
MSNKNESNCDLLECIPSYERTPEQVAYWHDGSSPETYKLLQDPKNLQELREHARDEPIAVWTANNILIYVATQDIENSPVDNRSSLCILFHGAGILLQIVGRTRETVIDATMFFLNMEEPSEVNDSWPEINAHSVHSFDFSSMGAHGVERLFEISPKRHVKLEALLLSVEQSIVLATRSQPIGAFMHS